MMSHFRSLKWWRFSTFNVYICNHDNKKICSFVCKSLAICQVWIEETKRTSCLFLCVPVMTHLHGNAQEITHCDARQNRRWSSPQSYDIIRYPLFADADTGIYPHAASQYHARPKAKRGITMLSVDKFPYPRKQTRGNEFIPCLNNICDTLKRFRSFKIPAITLIWPKSSYKHRVTRSYRSGKESGRRSESPLWRHQWRSFVFISHADDVKREIRLHISRLLTNQKRESARNMG